MERDCQHEYRYAVSRLRALDLPVCVVRQVRGEAVLTQRSRRTLQRFALAWRARRGSILRPENECTRQDGGRASMQAWWCRRYRRGEEREPAMSGCTKLGQADCRCPGLEITATGCRHPHHSPGFGHHSAPRHHLEDPQRAAGIPGPYPAAPSCPASGPLETHHPRQSSLIPTLQTLGRDFGDGESRLAICLPLKMPAPWHPHPLSRSIAPDSETECAFEA